MKLDFNLVPSNPKLVLPWGRSLLKTLLENGENAGNQDFSFSHSVLYPIWEKIWAILK